MKLKFTVFGGHGFIGSHIVQHLRAKGYSVNVPGRDLSDVFDRELGHVIYSIGLTADFRSRPFDTVEAHVCLLSKLLQKCRFDSWLYLSSTRVYSGLDLKKMATEKSSVVVAPGSDSLYNLSKLLGESLCLACAKPNVRVARLSNVYGAGISADTFLGSVIDDLRVHGRVTVNESPDSGKDYVASSDVVSLLEVISLRGLERLYNVASGQVITHKTLFEKIGLLTGLATNFSDGGITRTFPLVDISVARKEFGFQPKNLLDAVGALLADCGVLHNPGDDS